MKPFIHSQISKHKFGGKCEDYQAIHDFIDSPKIAYPNIKHRALLHNSFGCYLVEKIFGRHHKVIINRDNILIEEYTNHS